MNNRSKFSTGVSPKGEEWIRQCRLKKKHPLMLIPTVDLTVKETKASNTTEAKTTEIQKTFVVDFCFCCLIKR